MLDQVIGLLTDESGPVMLPKGVCLGWDPEVLWAQAIADAVTVIAYFAMPLVLMYVSKNRESIRSDKLMLHSYLAYASFLFFGGLDKLVSMPTLWYPTFYLQTFSKWMTAVVTISAVIVVAKSLSAGLRRREELLKSALARGESLSQTLRTHDAAAVRRRHLVEKDLVSFEEILQQVRTQPGTVSADHIAIGLESIIDELRTHLVS